MYENGLSALKICMAGSCFSHPFRPKHWLRLFLLQLIAQFQSGTDPKISFRWGRGPYEPNLGGPDVPSNLRKIRNEMRRQ